MQPDKRPFLSKLPLKLHKSWKLYASLAVLGGSLAGMGWLTTGNAFSESNSSGQPANVTAADVLNPTPQLRTYDLMQGTVHVVSVPLQSKVSVAVADELTTVAELAEQNGAIAAINAGFFDPQNGKTTSHLVSQSQPAGDPSENERLTENPDLQEYLSRILSRSEFRTYACEFADGQLYDIAGHDVPTPRRCTIEHAVGAGPQLLPDNTAPQEAFTAYEDGEIIRDAIGSVQPNARSAIGIREDGSLLLFMVAQRYNAAGMTLVDLAEFAKTLEVKRMLNLDGGSSSSLYFNGEIYLGKLNGDGNPIERPVKSAIIINEQ